MGAFTPRSGSVSTDDRGDLAAGAGGGRHRDQRQGLVAHGSAAGMVFLDRVAAVDQRGGLGGIDRAASPEGHHEVRARGADLLRDA